MKIGMFGNVLNWGYLLGKALILSGHEVDLFLKIDENIKCYDPSWEDDDFDIQSNKWIHYENLKLSNIFNLRFRSKLLKTMNVFDVLIAIGEYAIWVSQAQKPYIVISYGGDLDELLKVKCSVKSILLSRLLKSSFRKAARFIYALPTQRALINKHKIKNSLFKSNVVPIDVKKYLMLDDEKKAIFRSKYSEQYVFFHPARQEWRLKDSNDKGNDRLFYAFARFVCKNCSNSLLIAIEKGRDVNNSKQLVKELGIERNVSWRGEMNKEDLIKMFNSVDALFDQFVYGYYGVLDLEAMSCGLPVFTYINVETAKNIELPSIFNVSSIDEIYTQMIRFSQGQLEYSPEGLSNWVKKHHDSNRIANELIEIINQYCNA